MILAPVGLLLQRCRGVIIVLIDARKGEAAAMEDDEPEGEGNGEELEEHPHFNDARSRQASSLRNKAAGESAAAAHGNGHKAHEDRSERGREAVLRLKEPGK